MANTIDSVARRLLERDQELATPAVRDQALRLAGRRMARAGQRALLATPWTARTESRE